MKTLVISNLYPPHGIGGYEERCLHAVESLRARGHDVHVLTSNHHVESRDASGEDQIHRKLHIHGFYGHPLPIHKLYTLEHENQATLRTLLEKLQPDVIHVWNMGGITKSLLHTLEAQPIPLVYDISDHWIARSLSADVWLSWWNDSGTIARNTLRTFATLLGIRRSISKNVPTDSVKKLKFKDIYFCSQFMRDISEKAGYPVGHADIVYCGVELEHFEKKVAYHPPRKFMWVGRLAEDKDPLTALKGFLRARDAEKLDLELDIYGRGDPDYTAQLEAEIAKAHAGEFVRLKSATHKEMRALYSKYDAYIFSSNWGEPFALTPLEAMSSGVPVLMCPDGGDAELVDDGINALKFAAGSPSSLAGAIARLLQLNDYGERMAKAAYKEVEARFTIEVMTDKIEAILKKPPVNKSMVVDLIKGFVLANGYFIAGPIGGLILSKDRRMEDFAVCVLMFLLGLHIDTTVLMLGSIEWYRGVTKGYEFTMMEILSVSIIFSTIFNSKRKFILLPFGTILWFLYIGASTLSIISALNLNYVFMSILKHAKVWLIVLAIGNYVRTRREVHVVLTGISVMLIYQFFIVAKMKWIDGFYQVRGLFEHQNPLAMFTYMAALPILAVAMSPATSKLRGMLYFFAFACSGIIVLASLSRAALAFFAMGTAAVVAAGFFDRISGKRILIVALMAMGGTFVLAMTIETIISRFNDEGNEASGETRDVMNLASEAMLKANPFGVGWNNFGKAINHPYPYGDVIDQWTIDRGQTVDYEYAKGVVESHYWLLKGETGYLGYFTFMLFITVVTGATIPLILLRRGSLEAAIAVGILIGFGITYVHSSLERVLTQTKNLALWMTYIGLLGALLRLPKLKKGEESSLE